MKILNIMQGTNLGGMEQSSLSLMKTMSSIGCVFDVLSLTPFGPLKDKLEELNINLQDCSYLGIGGWRSFFEIKSCIKKSNADCLMMTGHSLIGMLALGNKCEGRRVLTLHFHHQDVKPRIIWRLIYFIACKKFNHIIYASKFIRDEAISIYPRVKKISQVINNPLTEKTVASNEQKQRSREKLGLSQEGLIFGNAGWLIKRKRFDIFLNLAARIKKKYPSAQFLIAGDGEEKNSLMQLSHDLGISEDIIWLGWQENLEDFYNSLDFLIFNSDWDAVGLSPLEAVLKGIYLIASVENGGLSELLINEHQFFFHHEHDFETLMKKIIYILENPLVAHELIMSLRMHIIDISYPPKIARQTKNIFLELA